MNRLIVSSASAIAALAGLAGSSAPASAQDSGGDKVNTLIIYGDDQCPQSNPGEIVVCARMDEGERYRVPEVLRQNEGPTNEAWATRVRSFETVGDFGPMSCTAVGAGGNLGCTAQLIEAAYQERAQAPGVRFSQLIEEERQKRLATIDEDAADTQARVEEIERQYAERLRQAREDGTADTVVSRFEQAPIGEEVPITPPVSTTDVGVPPPLVDPAPEDNLPRPVAPHIPTVINPQ
ncbi:hypothetical protein [Altericroceibacterium xinjiangense]|uniref:hypothetical protein n=1 Tax=Altericroceibacterium xinjiangense TaxID=762261 RepID=UPI0019D1AA2F|nr:hypothetical protein [Altericroceibacterium xinjiangense]